MDMRILIIVLAVICCSCGTPYKIPERRQQSLIYDVPPEMSQGFASVTSDAKSVTLVAHLGDIDDSTSAERINVQRLSSIAIISDGRQDMRVGPVDINKPRTQLYAAFSARVKKQGRVVIGIYQNDMLIKGLLKVVQPGLDWKRYRFTLHIAQPIKGITVRVQTDATVEIEDFGALSKTTADDV